MRVLVLCDLDAPSTSQNFTDDLASDDWESEAAVMTALRALGHEARLFGVCDTLEPLLAELKSSPPDLVFNLAEAFRRDRALEPHLASLLELLGIAYTGASPKALQLCKDKALAKRVVAHELGEVEGLAVPRFIVSPRQKPLASLALEWPALVKPLSLEASAGISQDSFVENEADALARVKFVHERLGQDAIVEEFIEGRELYVSALGEWDGRVTIFPARELFFDEVPEGEPAFATYKAKWDDAYRKRWGIRSGFARAQRDDGALESRLADAGRLIYRALQITGYARIDFRLTPSGKLVFIEANPNPAIGPTDDFALAAGKAGVGYAQLVSRILKSSSAR